MPPDPVVKPGIWFIENADPYADGAVPSVADPELKTLFRVNIPFMDPGVIGNGLSFISNNIAEPPPSLHIPTPHSEGPVPQGIPVFILESSHPVMLFPEFPYGRGGPLRIPRPGEHGVPLIEPT